MKRELELSDVALHAFYAQRLQIVMDVVQTASRIMILVRTKNVQLQKRKNGVVYHREDIFEEIEQLERLI